jgi:acetylornithine deacetylase/succinyl-diaminopimelate desuccinylase-like protein
MMGILWHLDVVPTQKLNDWDRKPVDPIEKDELLYVRGTQGDKGSLLAFWYAVKALMDAGVEFNKRVRFIFGADEETLLRCIKLYTEKEETPSSINQIVAKIHSVETGWEKTNCTHRQSFIPARHILLRFHGCSC